MGKLEKRCSTSRLNGLTKNVSCSIYDILIWSVGEIVIKNDINSLGWLASCPGEREGLSGNRGWRHHAHCELIHKVLGSDRLERSRATQRKESPWHTRKHFRDSYCIQPRNITARRTIRRDAVMITKTRNAGKMAKVAESCLRRTLSIRQNPLGLAGLHQHHEQKKCMKGLLYLSEEISRFELLSETFD